MSLFSSTSLFKKKLFFYMINVAFYRWNYLNILIKVTLVGISTGIKSFYQTDLNSTLVNGYASHKCPTATVRRPYDVKFYKIVRPPYDFYGHRTVAVALFTHRTMPREILTRRYNCSRHRTMLQPQTASVAVRRPCGDRTVALGLSLQTLSKGTVRSPYDHRKILVR